MNNVIKKILIILVVLSSYSFASTFTEIKFDEKNISLQEAISLGFVPDVNSEKNKLGHVRFRIERPELVAGDCNVRFATVELFSTGQSLTSFMMTKYGTQTKEYFSANFNPSAISAFAVKVFCHNKRVYKFKVSANAL